MRRKLIISILSLVLLLATAVTSTYAFIVSNLEAYVSNINIEACSDNVCLMSIDGVNFSNDLTNEQILKAIIAKEYNYTFDIYGNFVDDGITLEATSDLIAEKISEIRLNAVTSNDGQVFYRLNSKGQPVNIKCTSKNYVSFDLYFKSNRDYDFGLYFNTDDLNTDLSYKTFKINGEDVEVSKTAEYGYKTYDEAGNIINNSKNDKVTVNAKNAVRMSVIADNNAKIYEPNLGLGSYATNLLSDDCNVKYKEYLSRYDGTKNAAYTYMCEAGYNYDCINYENMPRTYQSFETVDSVFITSINVNQMKKVTINIWAEGWDADCFDVISDAKVNVSLSFRGIDRVNSYQINYHDGDSTTSVNYLSSYYRTGQDEPILYKNGNEFLGWFTDKTYTTLFDFNTKINANEVKDVYALWAK